MDATTIYLDVLVLLNLFVTASLHQATARLTSRKPGKGRLLLGSLLGGLYALLILLELSPLELTVIKLLMGISLAFAVFWLPREGWRPFVKTALCFFLVNFLFAGFMQALWLFAAPAGMAYRNGVAYFNISALTLAVSTVAAYLLISLAAYLLNKRSRRQDLAELTVTLRGRQALLTGFVDTGNKLCDVFTGLPVLICEYRAIQAVLPERIQGFFQDPAGFSFQGLEDSGLALLLRVIPVEAVNGSSCLPAFRPDGLLVDGVPREAMIAVTGSSLSDGRFQALIGPGLVA